MARWLAGSLGFCAIILVPKTAAPDWAKMFVVWNVGQGQWLTYIDADKCLHFDMGGERADLRLIRKFCGDRLNQLWLSHGDWDHLNLIRKSSLPGLCLVSRRPRLHSRAKRRMVDPIENCERFEPPVSVWAPPASEKTSNGQSLVTVANGILISGDSSQAQEKKWAWHKDLTPVKTLVAGHHGSRTSSGEFLLKQLPNLGQAIASCRKARYGHPHFETEERFRRRNVPLITTEDWGNLRIAN